MKSTLRFVVLSSMVSLAIALGARAQAPEAKPQEQKAPNPKQQALEQLLAKGQKSVDALTPEELLQLLQLGKELGEPQTVSAIAKTSLARNMSPPPALVKLAAENALLAGDYRTAISRYKQYLRAVPPSPEASDTAAVLYQILIDYVGEAEDAFQFMNENGEKFRQSVNAKKFDGWYVWMAREKRAFPAMAKRLALLFSEQLPLEQERAYYWRHLDLLMAEVAQAGPESFEVVAPCRQIVSLIREAPIRKLRYQFYVDHLAYRAGAAGKEATVLEKEFEPVAAAARAYFDAAPNAATLQDVLVVFSGGASRPNDPDWNRALNQKRELFKYAFAKLNDADKEAMMRYDWWGMNTRIATPEMWAEFGKQFPDLFRRSPQTARLPFVTATADPAVLKAQAPFLQGVPSTTAAMITSLAASDDLHACVQAAMQQQSWFLDFAEIHSVVAGYMFPTYNGFTRDEAHKLAPGTLEKAQMQYASEYLFKSPLAIFQPDAVRDYMRHAWNWSGADANDKTKVADVLHTVDWVPYTDEQRRNVFSAVQQDFKAWADESRRLFEEARKGRDGGAKALDDATKAKADLTRQLEENRKAIDDAKKAQADATAALDAGKKAQADATKAQADAQVALKAAQDAKDENKAAEVNKQIQDLTKAIADFGPRLQGMEKAIQDMAAKIAERDKTTQDLNAKIQQQDQAMPDLTKRAQDSADAIKQLDARVALIAPLEQTLQLVSKAAVTDVNKAPDPLSMNLAKAVQALQAKNLNAYTDACRAAYALVRDYETKKTPYGAAALNFMLVNRLNVFDTFDFQCEVTADQLNLFAQQGSTRALFQTVALLTAGRPGWSWLTPPAAEKPKLDKLNAIIGKATLDMLNRNQFKTDIYNLFRYVRVDNEQTRAICAKFVEQKVLQNTPDYRLGHTSMTCSYLWSIRNDYPWMNDKYPQERYFDDMFVTEVAQTKLIDTAFWAYSRDELRKGYNASATLMQDFAKLPFGYDDAKLAYNPDTFWDAQSRALSADDAVRNAMLAKVESYFGTTRFDEYAMGRFAPAYIPVDKPDTRKLFFDKLAAFVERARQATVRVSPPSLPQLPSLGKPADLSDAELNLLVRIFQDTPWTPWSAVDINAAIVCVQEGLVAKNRGADLLPLIPQFWRFARDSNNGDYQRRLAQYAAVLMEAGEAELAAAYSTAGMELLGTRLPEDARNTLLAIRAKSLSTMGNAIPVERGDRRFPIFASQAAYMAGKFDNAWELYGSSRGLALTEFKDLDPMFSIWLIEKNTEIGSYDEADAIARKMIEWVDSAPQGFDPEVRAHLLVTYADIAFARQEFPRAKAQYERVAVAKEFDGTLSKRVGELKIAEVDRITKHYDAAIERLESLARRRDAFLQAEANYQLALVKFDQEEYAAARDYVNQVMAVDPNHPNARILEGKLYLKMKKLVEATEVKVGLSASQATIVPGRPLRVQIEDRNLAIVGKAADIEVRVWSDSGDEEFFSLLPFGDSKTKFEGQVPTALAATKKGDHTLQVLGGDKVHYDFSERFKQANKIAKTEPPTIVVVSDAELYISSGKILTKEELEQRALEKLIRDRTPMEDYNRSTVALSTIRSEDEIKPGNKINVRVVDPDRSTTSNKDKIRVQASTSSGDKIDGFELEETEGYSGVFEGEIPTASAAATAFASDSDEGREPNFAISKGDYPGWVGLADNRRPKLFGVDLNNDVNLGKMNVLADVPARRLKSFAVQTSMNGKDFTTIGTWPAPMSGWDGSLQMETMRYSDRDGVPARVSEFQDYIRAGFLTRGVEKVVLAGVISTNIGENVLGLADRFQMPMDGWHSWYIVHIQGAFSLSERQSRTFRLDHKGRLQNIRYFLTIDGQEGKSPYEITLSLGKGVHVLDLYLCAQRRASPAFEIQCDIPEPPYMARCPADMFDAAKHPEVTAKVKFEPCKVVPGAGTNSFDIAFSAGTHARMVRLWIADFETDAPAIRKISLLSTEQQPVLPAQEDVVTLKQNRTLEIVPGDRISVTYDDPDVVTREKQVQEAFMKATFYNATLSACFVESVVDERGNRIPQYIPMRRFKPGDVINVFVNEPDADISDEPDKLKFSAQGSSGKPVELEALETDAHSGIFIGKVFAVAGQPQRPSEITIGKGDDVLLTYVDERNTDYGIPWKRTYTVEQTTDVAPQLRVYDVASRPLTDAEIKAAVATVDVRHFEEVVPMTRSIVATRPPEPYSERPATGMFVAPLIVELTYPTVAQSPLSKATLYVQTSSGRKMAGRTGTNEFDINVPGTLKLELGPGDAGTIQPPQGYRDVLVRGNPFAANALEDGRFTFLVPMQLGDTPAKTLVNESVLDPRQEQTAEHDPSRFESIIRVPIVDARGDTKWVERRISLPKLTVNGGDEVFIGFPYTTNVGSTNEARWLTKRVQLQGDIFFHLMDRRYQQTLEKIHVGERVFVRVIDPMRDLTNGKDEVNVQFVPVAGAPVDVKLMETFGHSGIFKGSIQPVFAGDQAKAAEPGVLPTKYGDTFTAKYTVPDTKEVLERSVATLKGANGFALPFTKRFKDPELAVQTQFTVAEAYFEMAKKHRELKQDVLARREIAQGKKLLEEAIRDYPTTEARAQADYLLAELALEFANDTVNEDIKKQYYTEAITRFSDIVASYSESPYAPKAQFKKALVFEKLGQIDQACEEYVKLSYRYPDNELVAETIARLGQYFLTKGKDIQDRMNTATNIVEKEKLHIQATDMYKTAAQVFGRLSKRFPDHQLAGKTTVLSAQCYMRAEDYPKAIDIFKQVITEKKADNELIAQSMYWCGDCSMKQHDYVNAYRMFKKLTWDYPESMWAKYARGRLAEKELSQVEEKDTSGSN